MSTRPISSSTLSPSTAPVVEKMGLLRLIARISRELLSISQEMGAKERRQQTELEQTYSRSNREWCQLQNSQANWSLASSLSGAALYALGITRAPEEQKFFQFLGDQLPNTFNGWLTRELQVQMRREDSTSQFTLAKMNNQGSQAKEEMKRVADELLQATLSAYSAIK